MLFIPAQSFEDNLDIWMEGFRQLLTLPVPIKALFVKADDDKLSAMHQMQRRCACPPLFPSVTGESSIPPPSTRENQQASHPPCGV